MHALEVACKAGVGGVVTEGRLESVRRRAPLGDEPSDRHAVTGDDDGLAVLNGVKDISEGARSLRCGHRDHEYILSD